MDALTHTLLATGLLAVSYYVGKYLGNKEGRIHAWLHLCYALGASGITVEEDGKITIQYPDGSEEELDQED